MMFPVVELKMFKIQVMLIDYYSEAEYLDSDDHYNDTGVDLVYFKLEDGDRPIDITQLSIQGETETVVIDVPTG